MFVVVAMDVENPRSALMDKLSPVSMYANFTLDVFAIAFFLVWGVVRRLGRLVWRASRKSLKKEIVLVRKRVELFVLVHGS